ncbi:hypothetical protein E6W39_32480 [Kitasatospora acidiphila]|uniref:Uncharacterized protein n=1 Tax=Kitasatospora acidiphila TaxID=2567942 RepID=A0A540WAQ3_9ACTN|nr:hypothetical protein [Kitasatospora acidiphila]TQF06076.1 hypothetical protein E6W39_32480 [Kitasatospora acidiphila]
MPDTPRRLLGVEAIEDLVRDCWVRARTPGERRPDRELPVIALLGRHGSGKTSVLRYLAHRASTAPQAGHDFAAGTLRPHEVAARLAFRLSLSPKGPRFPRLTHGLVAVDPDLRLDVTSPDRARRQLEKRMREARARGAGLLADALSEGVGLLNDFGVIPVPGAGLLAALLLRGLGPRLLNASSRAGLEWYGGDRGQPALDALVALNERSKSEHQADQNRVDRLLCEAFLADLRAAYQRPGGAGRERNCLVVLDNIDRGGGTRFLALLLEVRDSLMQRDGGGCDPLLAVAAASTARAVPGPFDPGPAGLRIRDAHQASYADWRSGIPQFPADSSWWWYAVQLPDLTAGQVSRLAAAIDPQLPEATPLVHRLTYGHPWSVLRMQQAAARMIDHQDADNRLRGILDSGPVGPEVTTARPADDNRLTLRQESLRYLLQDMEAEQLAALATCAASRDIASAVNSPLLTGFPDRIRETLLEETAERLWLVPSLTEDAGTRGGRGSGYLPTTGRTAHPQPLPDTLMLQPWLWLLLLRELAARGPGGPYPDWDTAHQRLHDWHADREGHQVSALSHQLSLGQVESVVAHLEAGLSSLPTEAWLYELYAITAAPMREPVDATVSASHRADQLARRLAPEAFRRHRALALLVTALWLAVDPRNRLPSARPELNFTISASFRDLALHTPDANGAVLRSEAARYESHSF